MKLRALVTLLGALLVAPYSAFAATEGDWLKSCQAGAVTGNLQPGGYACYTPVTNSSDSPVLSTSDCENVDVLTFADADGDASDCDVLFNIEICPVDAAGLANDTALDNACYQAPGTVAVGIDTTEVDLAVKLMRVSGNEAGAAPTECRIEVYCAGPAGQ